MDPSFRWDDGKLLRQFPKRLQHQPVEMVQAVFADEGAIGVDHQAALAVAERMQPPLDAFDEADVFGLEHFVEIADRLPFLLRWFVTDGVEIEVLERGFGASWHDVQHGDQRRAWKIVEGDVWIKPPGGKIPLVARIVGIRRVIALPRRRDVA